MISLACQVPMFSVYTCSSFCFSSSIDRSVDGAEMRSLRRGGIEVQVSELPYPLVRLSRRLSLRFAHAFLIVSSIFSLLYGMNFKVVSLSCTIGDGLIRWGEMQCCSSSMQGLCSLRGFRSQIVKFIGLRVCCKYLMAILGLHVSCCISLRWRQRRMLEKVQLSGR